MGHKADNSFFDEKKPWSKRKDLILHYYLEPYLPKVWTLKCPILLVDGFAGPGKFGDGNLGSPLIICQRALEAVRRGIDVRVLCIEARSDLYEHLAENLRSYSFAEARLGRFLDSVPEIERLAHSHSVFLYIDPYAIEGLQWEGLDRIFRHLHESRMSIEVLLNFNANAFGRRARAAMKKAPPPDEESDTDDLSDSLETTLSAADRLNRVVGGEWWQTILERQLAYAQEVDEVVTGFCSRIRDRFREVCQHAVKEKWHHTIPKYVLLFGSRSPHALKLMNDAAVKSREMFADSVTPTQPTLFETRPVEVVPDSSKLAELLLDLSRNRMPRGQLVVRIARAAFGEFSTSEIARCITALIKSGQLCSATGKARINDGVDVWNPAALV